MADLPRAARRAVQAARMANRPTEEEATNAEFLWQLKKVRGTLRLILVAIVLAPFIWAVLAGLGFVALRETQAAKVRDAENTFLRGVAEQAGGPEQETGTATPRVDAAEHAYMASSVRIDGFRVGRGKGTFGQEGRGFWATLVNEGSRTLSMVKVRVYFLDESGRRIGEEDYIPVWSEGIGKNTSPLRPGYRQDFGYLVDDDAPSGWDGKVEAQVVDIAFAVDEER